MSARERILLPGLTFTQTEAAMARITTSRMDGGGVQTLTQDNPGVQVDDRVRITSDGRVVRHSG